MKLVPVIASILVPVALYFSLSYIAEKWGKGAQKYLWILLCACFIYGVAWYLPSPMIDGLDTGFWTHFAGGVATGFIWLYLYKTKVWPTSGWVLQAVILYALVSSLGVLNELAEFVLVKTNLFPISLADTSYDLVANTLGALTLFAVYKITEAMKR